MWMKAKGDVKKRTLCRGPNKPNSVLSDKIGDVGANRRVRPLFGQWAHVALIVVHRRIGRCRFSYAQHFESQNLDRIRRGKSHVHESRRRASVFLSRTYFRKKVSEDEASLSRMRHPRTAPRVRSRGRTLFTTLPRHPCAKAALVPFPRPSRKPEASEAPCSRARSSVHLHWFKWTG